MHWQTPLQLINLFFAGTLSGIEIGTHYGLVRGTNFLTEKAQLQLRQALILRLRVLVPAFFVPAFLSTILVIVTIGTGAGFALRAAAFAGYLVWVYARIVATVRINSQTLEWDLAAPPPSWRDGVARAERFHIASLWAVTAGFACLLLAYAVGGPRR
jgi:hypothetical protein